MNCLRTIVASFLLSSCSLLFAQGSGGPQVHAVSLKYATGVDALLWLGEVYKRPFGLIATDASILKPTISVELPSANYELAFKAVIVQLPKYKMRDIDGVTFIEPVQRDPATEHLFTTSLARYDSQASATVSELANLLWMDVELSIDPSIRGFAGLTHESDRFELPPIHLADVSVREVLDQLVRQSKSAAWIGFSAPKQLRGVQRDRLWSIVTYQDPPIAAQDLCCLNRAALALAR